MNDRVGVGRISGVFGVRGWVKVYSYTSPRANVVNYTPWVLRRDGTESLHRVLAGHAQGDGVVASLAGVDDRDAAAALVGAEIEVDRAMLGPRLQDHGNRGPETGEYFWADLEGMQVLTLGGVPLGTVDHLFETGSNDVMVVVGSTRHLVPFLYGSVVQAVDGDRREITVDWDPDF